MLIIKNNLIPVKGFTAINLFGILFIRKGGCINDKTICHEQIHSKQIKEVMFTLFPAFGIVACYTTFKLLIIWIFSYYIWYVVEWLVHLIGLKDAKLAYKRISFEREAYANEDDPSYLCGRKSFAFIQYYGKI